VFLRKVRFYKKFSKNVGNLGSKKILCCSKTSIGKNFTSLFSTHSLHGFRNTNRILNFKLFKLCFIFRTTAPNCTRTRTDSSTGLLLHIFKKFITYKRGNRTRRIVPQPPLAFRGNISEEINLQSLLWKYLHYGANNIFQT